MNTRHQRRPDIDWPSVLNRLRVRCKPLARLARDVGSDERTLNRIARGEVHEPRHSVGERLLAICDELGIEVNESRPAMRAKDPSARGVSVVSGSRAGFSIGGAP